MENDTTDHIDSVLRDSAFQRPMEDPTGFRGLVDIMIGVKQLRDAAIMAGFTPAEAMDFARDLAKAIFEASRQQAQEGQ